MNKLMIGLAAAGLCTAVFADVTSANIVGYDVETAVEGNAFFCPMFLNVDGSDMNLQDIQFEYSTPNGQYTLQTLNSGKGRDECYMWYKRNSSDEIGPNGNKTKIDHSKNGGWYKLTYEGTTITKREYIADKTFSNGDGVMVNCGKSGYKLTFAGSVSDAQKVLPCREGNSFYGNPYAAPINLQDIQFDYSAPNGQYTLQTLNSGKGRDECYMWYKRNSSDEIGPNGNKTKIDHSKNGGWYKLTYEGTTITKREYVADKTFASGAGFMLNCGKSGYNITLTSPYKVSE